MIELEKCIEFTEKKVNVQEGLYPVGLENRLLFANQIVIMKSLRELLRR